jgi:ribonucleoside-diphosphate reductase alpha chain
LALDHLPYEKRAGLGIFTADERAGQLNESTEHAAQSPAAPHESDQLDAPVVPHEMGSASVPASVHSSAELLEAITGKTADAPLCMTCGIKMRPAGSCYVCEGCGSTSGCS